jgi:hypothetical protein
MTVPRNLFMLTGAGDDAVELRGVSVGHDALVITGGGNDRVRAAATGVGHNLAVFTNWNEDAVVMTDVGVRHDLLIHTGLDADRVMLTGVDVGFRAVMTTLTGDDLVSVESTSVGRFFNLHTGAGNDTVLVGVPIDAVTSDAEGAGLSTAYARIFTGVGDDTVDLRDSSIEGNLMVLLDRGDDSLYAEGVDVAMRAWLIGGPDWDTVNRDIEEVNDFNFVQIIGFEEFVDPGAE